MFQITAFIRDERAATSLEYGLIVTGTTLGTLAVFFRNWREACGRILVAQERAVAERVASDCGNSRRQRTRFPQAATCLNSVANGAERRGNEESNVGVACKRSR